MPVLAATSAKKLKSGLDREEKHYIIQIVLNTSSGGGHMASKGEKLLTNLELELMKTVWKRGKATVKEVKNALPRRKPLAYSTVLTVMRILERKGFVRHDTLDRTYVYYPVVTRDEVIEAMVRNLANRLFDGSAELLMVNVLEKEKLGREELRRLKRVIAVKEKEAEK
jgi:predicted transcriptional regulator